ncbi:MAG TPA: MqnA/MqnD/SBP family protein, partial [Chitinophagaceae bacterium]
LQVTGEYKLLHAGSALGKNCGPLLIAKSQIPVREIPQHRIAIPGVNTTANLLLGFAFPEATRVTPMLFSEIEDAVLSGKTDMGLIIHENRFTYQQKGLLKIIDLGEYWEEKTGCPIPLGGIAIHKKLDASLQQTIDRLLRQSLEYAFALYPQLPPFVTDHAQEMDEKVMRQHIDLYVNEYSLDLGEDGMHAIRIMAEKNPRWNLMPERLQDIFV